MHVFLQDSKQIDKFFFIKGVPKPLTLSFPVCVCFRKNEGLTHEVLEHSFIGASLVNLRILCHIHILDKIWLAYGQEHCAEVYNRIKVVAIVKREVSL